MVASSARSRVVKLEVKPEPLAMVPSLQSPERGLIQVPFWAGTVAGQTRREGILAGGRSGAGSLT